MRAAYLTLLVLCAMTMAQIALVAGNKYLVGQSFGAIDLVVATTLGVGALIVGVRTYRKLAALRDRSGSKGAHRKSLKVTPRLFATLAAPPGALALFFLLVGLKRGDLRSLAPALLFFASTMAFFGFRYLQMRRKHGRAFSISLDPVRPIGEIFGGMVAVVWAVGTLTTIIVIALALPFL